MVYCGKPSRGCQMCRTRRIKCDETKPTCLQCQKSRRQCPGYKDDFDLVFRNETQATERRARRPVIHGRKMSAQNFQRGHQISFQNPFEGYSNSGYETSLITPTSDSDSSITLSPTGGLGIPIKEQATCFFLQNFVHTPSDPTYRGWFDFLIPLVKSEDAESHLNIAFSAVALASLANRPNTKGRGLMPQAINLYTKALKAINLALQTPAQQKSDATLASIILLGFFETVTSERSNVMAWGSHIDGAVQLVKMRGKKQLRTKTGHALFISVRTQMLIHCMATSKAPLLGMEWWVIESSTDYSVFIIKTLLQVAELRAQLSTIVTSYPRTNEYIQKVQDLIRLAKSIEQEFVDWENAVPDAWRVKTAAWVENVPGGDIAKADVCPGKVDMYEDIFIAVNWNHARVARLLLSNVVVRGAAWICSPVDYRTTPEYATCARIGVEMIAGIIASIPYLLGWRPDQKVDFDSGNLAGFSSGSDSTSSQALGGFFCTWPLFCAICSDYTTDSQRQWITGRMNLIGDKMGMSQAKTIASFQLRLPSMLIRRDSMGSGPYSLQVIARKAMLGGPPSRTPLYIPITTADLEAAKASPPPSSSGHSLSLLQQKLAMQREVLEQHPGLLLAKAAKLGSQAAERVISDYLKT